MEQRFHGTCLMAPWNSLMAPWNMFDGAMEHV